MHYQKLLRSRGLKATPQRLAVLSALSDHTHPTIDELYSQLRITNPSISLATVYKNLSILLSHNIVIEVNTQGQKPKYDIYEHPHIHILCGQCGEVYDLASEPAQLCQYTQTISDKFGSSLTHLNIVATAQNCPKCKG